MKRLFLFTMMCLFGLFSLNAQTQVEVNVGQGTSFQQTLPVHEYFKYSYSQQIYTSDELQNLAGEITSISFKLATTSDYVRTYAIYMANTDMESYASSYDWIPMAEENLVFSGTVISLA